ncbi:sulfatase-like hydrolase/transferase [Granulosicoccus sp. 3-233]|uniref:sulfatase-like hydrolase/transferase n=1 Tax=Granulosicoccus sp. 3-233 TaxID=3417969 RepID=UPI003D33D4D4
MTETNKAAGRNLVIIMSDEHNRDWSGCYGHALARTPHIDALAARGTRFSSAYCNSPICVPSRAAFATGRFVHDTGHWDNAFPYAGSPTSWHQLAREAGVRSTSIGKLHFRGGDDNGFSEEIIPLHVVDGIGDVKGAIRDPLPAKKGCDALARDAGPGLSEYARYDFQIRDRAVDYLKARALEQSDGESAPPFVLFVSLVMPHFPLIAPQDFYDQYANLSLDELTDTLQAPSVDHPVLLELQKYMNYDEYFDDESRSRALRAYLGMVSTIDAIVGDITSVVEGSSLSNNTCMAYTSDHGDNLGNRGLWGKSVMYEDSVAVPLILAGPDVPQGHVCSTPVSLVDFHPTVLDVLGIERPATDMADTLPGCSLQQLASTPDEPERAVFSEYHAAGACTGMFMLRCGAFKLVAYSGYAPQLFNLEDDPGEVRDLADQPEYAAVLASLREAMAAICDIEAVNRQVFEQQQALVERHGGRDAVLSGTDIPHTPAPV